MSDDNKQKRQLNFGFMLTENHYQNINIDDWFSQKIENEVAKMFYNDDIETFNKLFAENGKNQQNSI